MGLWGGQHAENGKERPVLLAVDQQLGSESAW